MMALSELMLVTDGDKRDCGLSQLFRFLEDSKRNSLCGWIDRQDNGQQ